MVPIDFIQFLYATFLTELISRQAVRKFTHFLYMQILENEIVFIYLRLQACMVELLFYLFWFLCFILHCVGTVLGR